MRHESESGQWESVKRQPAASLREFVRCYHGWLEFTAGRSRRREVPTGEVVLVINLGEPFHVLNLKDSGREDAPLLSFASGVSDSYVFTESARSMHVLQVDFTPLGAHLLFGLPMHSLANHEVRLDELLGPAAIELEGHLREAPTWEKRFALLEHFIEVRFAVALPPEPRVAWAMRRLKETGGIVSISGLAADLGWADRRLINAFREHVGLPPKTMARIIRFNRVTRLARQVGPPRWADIAYRCGYYDQAHLVHDFRQFSGLTPTDFLAGGAADMPLPG
ncbi:MAG: helix-turn-helix domain-containing protein [Dehalococcoidia bacterium]